MCEQPCLPCDLKIIFNEHLQLGILSYACMYVYHKYTYKICTKRFVHVNKYNYLMHFL
jgi:hypothetical protein